MPSSRKIWVHAGVGIFWLLVWYAVYRAVDRELYMPSPAAVLLRLAGLASEAGFWKDVLLSVGRIAAGFLLSVAAGTVLGILSGLYRPLYVLLNPVVTAIKATPVISFIMVALFWFSSGRVPVFIGFLMCFPIMWTQMAEGIRRVDPKLLELARVYRVSLSSVVRKIYVPSLVPFFSPACVTSLGFAWKVGVAAEVLSHPKLSIGGRLYEAKAYLESTDLFAWTLVVVLLSLIFETLLDRVIRRWRPEGGGGAAG
ncbi:ABC transporter permease [Gorillibacterium sp. sgz5001074]|uniref:ABC transporter permease n=1 Tax=Gorillibacterium sp. sgz5001074 TaxID=3446695 RepID=UPI003F6756D0